MAFEPNNLILERKQVRLPKLLNAFDGFRIVLLTDLHLHPFTTTNQIRRTVEISNALKPDLVLLGGDFVCGCAEAAFELASILERLNAKHGLFAVLGNHDHYRGAYIVSDGLHRASIRVLMNEGVRLTVGDDSIFLAGIDSVSASQPDPRAAFSARKNEAVSLAPGPRTGLYSSVAQAGRGGSAIIRSQSRRPGTYSRPGRNHSPAVGPDIRRRSVPHPVRAKSTPAAG
jgi:predicted MPP superfamily phosphohydrolase